MFEGEQPIVHRAQHVLREGLALFQQSQFLDGDQRDLTRGQLVAMRRSCRGRDGGRLGRVSGGARLLG